MGRLLVVRRAGAGVLVRRAVVVVPVAMYLCGVVIFGVAQDLRERGTRTLHGQDEHDADENKGREAAQH